MPYIKSEFLVEKPKYNSIRERKEDEIKVARQRVGLLETINHIKDTGKDPSLAYKEQPKAISKTLLD